PRVCLGLRVGATGLDVIAEGAFGAYAPILGASAADGSAAAFNVELQHFSVALGARYWLPFGVRGSFHLSILAGLQRTSSTVSLRAAPQTKLSDTELGLLIRAGGGVGYYLGIGRLIAQLEYTLAPVGGLIRGNLGGAGLSLGYLASF
ncbi:MAG: hypothetical protein H6Q89_1348, partial [Myxococcaceae bacterium]|nr:hypothetical protein [Myxococcaceae bacterium]